MSVTSYGINTTSILNETHDFRSDLNKFLKNRYGNLILKFNHRLNRPVLYEKFKKYGQQFLRELWRYENPDGSIYPICCGVLERFLCEAQTCSNPMSERVKKIIEDNKNVRRKAEEAPAKVVKDVIDDDYDRLVGKTKVFFGNSMEEWKAKPAPYQEKYIKD